MTSRSWKLVLSLTCFVLATMIGYMRWTNRFALKTTSMTSVRYDDNPPSAAARQQLQPSLPTGDTNDNDRVSKSISQRGRIFRYIVAPNNSSWTCAMKLSNKARSGIWQVVLKSTAYVYSAYLDPRYPNTIVVKVFGIISREEVGVNNLSRNVYYCMAWSQEKPVAMVTEATLLLIGRKRSSYSAVQFQCSYNRVDFHISAVAMVMSECPRQPNNAIGVTNLAKQRHERDFTVCLSGPLKHGYDNIDQFVEWTEINLQLGAERFFVYDYSIGKELLPYIKYYEKTGIMELVPWRLPLSLQFDPEVGKEFDTFQILWNYGQEILIADCLFRNMYTSRHVVYQDLDELIVPRQRDATTWSEMLQASNCNHSVTAVYIARNTFFMPSDDTESDDDLDRREMAPHNKSMFLANQRDDYVYETKHRSKYIAIPDQVILPYIHVVPQILDQLEQCVLSSDTGLLHHYRQPPHRRGPDVVDDTLNKYKEKVTANVQRVHKQVNKVNR